MFEAVVRHFHSADARLCAVFHVTFPGYFGIICTGVLDNGSGSVAALEVYEKHALAITANRNHQIFCRLEDHTSR